MMALHFFAIVNFNSAFFGNVMCKADVASCAFALAGLLAIYWKWFFVFSLWHAVDIVQREGKSGNLARLLTGYPLFFLMAALMMSVRAMLISGQFETSGSCSGLFPILTESCYVPVPWLRSPATALSYIVLSLCLFKAGYALKSILRKRHDVTYSGGG